MRRRLPRAALPEELVDVFAVVCDVHATSGRAVVRDVANALSISTSTAHKRLAHLRRLGLVTWDDGTAGTLRPAVRVAARSPR